MGKCPEKDMCPREPAGEEEFRDHLGFGLGFTGGDRVVERPEPAGLCSGFILRVLGSHGRLEWECGVLLLTPGEDRWEEVPRAGGCQHDGERGASEPHIPRVTRTKQGPEDVLRKQFLFWGEEL